jgi:hypothetical protein
MHNFTSRFRISAGNVSQYLLLSFLIATLLYLQMQACKLCLIWLFVFAIPLLLFSIKFFL